jgi:hypothetical protein
VLDALTAAGWGRGVDPAAQGRLRHTTVDGVDHFGP